MDLQELVYIIDLVDKGEMTVQEALEIIRIMKYIDAMLGMQKERGI